MTRRTIETSPIPWARSAGALYLVIIVFGIFTEVAVRQSVMVPGDPAATANNLLASESLFRLGFLTDSVVFLSDAALAVLLYLLFRPVSRTLALVAAAFRLTQTAVLSLNLLGHHAALLLLDSPTYATAFDPEQLQALSHLSLELHGHGYDLGLLFFGVHCVVLGYLIVRSTYVPKLVGGLVIAAGLTYLVGTYTRFLLPGHVDTIAPIYGIAFLGELTFCLWLLVKGVRRAEWRAVTTGARGP